MTTENKDAASLSEESLAEKRVMVDPFQCWSAPELQIRLSYAQQHIIGQAEQIAHLREYARRVEEQSLTGGRNREKAAEARRIYQETHAVLKVENGPIPMDEAELRSQTVTILPCMICGRISPVMEMVTRGDRTLWQCKGGCW